jgi:hypothetical protein
MRIIAVCGNGCVVGQSRDTFTCVRCHKDIGPESYQRLDALETRSFCKECDKEYNGAVGSRYIEIYTTAVRKKRLEQICMNTVK